jgi:carbon-monoxide dehydrogenase medium subunit
VIPAAVRYHRATSLEDALEALAEPDARALAGGQSLIPLMKLRIARPSVVVDLSRLQLKGVEERDGELHLGPLATWSELAATPELRRPALAAIDDCARTIGDLQVRNRGTLGGSLVHADPASDMPAALLAFGARLVLRSPKGERTISLDDFLVGPFTTALEAQEIVTDVVVPLPDPGTGSAYVAVDHPASGFALAGAAAVVRAGERVSVALTGVGGRAALVPPETDVLAIDVFGDDFAPEPYKRHLVATFVRRALDSAAARAEEDERWQT